MELFNKDVDTYDELLRKRKDINDLFKYIKNSDFINMVMDTVSTQYNTILMERQDINTYDDLRLEKERKLEALEEIEAENNSDEFQNVLKVLIENERKKQEKILEEKRRIEEEEKKKRLEIEKKKQEEILKRQKIIEEARKKEIEKRTRQLLEQQQNSVLQGKKKDKVYNFETIKGNLREEEKNIEEKKQEEVVKNNDNANKEVFKPLDLDKIDNNKESEVVIKDKGDIEKELFAEFNNQDKENKKIDADKIFNSKVLEEIKEEPKEKKLPDVSIDEYMKNFDEKKVQDNTDFFGSNDVFPSIPM